MMHTTTNTFFEMVLGKLSQGGIVLHENLKAQTKIPERQALS